METKIKKVSEYQNFVSAYHRFFDKKNPLNEKQESYFNFFKELNLRCKNATEIPYLWQCVKNKSL